jgi:hypothetical protein
VGQADRGITAKSGVIHVENDLGLFQRNRYVNADFR